MHCGTCCKTRRFCPMSLGLALGITYIIALLVMGLVIMHRTVGFPWREVLISGVEAFFFGFVLALIYNLIQSACTSRFCCKSSGSCTCGKEKMEGDIKKP